MSSLSHGYTDSKVRHLQLVGKKVEKPVEDIFDVLNDDLSFDISDFMAFFAPKPILNPVAYSESSIIFGDYDYKECH